MGFQVNDIVIHEKFGQCTLMSFYDENSVFIKTSENHVEFCNVSEIKSIPKMNDSVSNHNTLKALLRLQSELISSINNAWGVFSQTSVSLLPHQLWVCNRVMKKWPTRMLIADDVGLGKTIEAGLILLVALNSMRAERVLILTPAKLTYQWQKRMKNMFNLSFDVYTSTDELYKNQFQSNKLIASMPTIKLDNNGRHESLLESDAWDLVIIDEAHHSGTTDDDKTEGYKLIELLEDHQKIGSMLFFTATPHQGKENDFWNLIYLLNPNINRYDYNELSNIMIRNNKARVTNMKGQKLFKKLNQHSYIFRYTPEEERFYQLMSSYILTGRAYAKKLNKKIGNQAKLILISLQKIASSSICAIKGALNNRLLTLKSKNQVNYDFLYEDEQLSDDENLSLQQEKVFLMEDEEKYIEELLEAADKVKVESRIEKIMEIIKEDYPNDSILLFTEYKATQSLMVSNLRAEYGRESVGFINGDNALFIDGRSEKSDRKSTMNSFNKGKLRYLVSTEASGEGVDLQESCHVLIHVDLPWNPMRLHQRVGRIFRYGQTKDVDVVNLRNPDTVESRIWDLLDQKLDRITMSLGSVMATPEDLKELVIGIANPSAMEELFAIGSTMEMESLENWFDQQNQILGDQTALDIIRGIEGNSMFFDKSDLRYVPKLDLENLRSFMEAALRVNGKKPRYNAEKELCFDIPQEWVKKKKNTFNIGLFLNQNYVFNRNADVKKICAPGELLFNKAMEQSRNFECVFGVIPGRDSYVIYRVQELRTVDKSLLNHAFVGYKIKYGSDWEVLNMEDLFRLCEKLLTNNYDDNAYQGEMPKEDEIEIYRQKAEVDYLTKGVEFYNPKAQFFTYLAASDL